MLNETVRQSIDESVLCWLATADENGCPNVSPKEVFLAFGDDEVIIANIASPKSEQNIRENPNVCVSFIHIFKQKGFKLSGKARILCRGDAGFASRFAPVHKITGDVYPVKNLVSIRVAAVSPIVAPSYFLYPDTTEQNQIESALSTYGFAQGVAPNE